MNRSEPTNLRSENFRRDDALRAALRLRTWHISI